jgi:hypothetical protein
MVARCLGIYVLNQNAQRGRCRHNGKVDSAGAVVFVQATAIKHQLLIDKEFDANGCCLKIVSGHVTHGGIEHVIV